MTEDDRDESGEGMEPEAFTQDDAGDPAAAFEALRATVEKLARDMGGEMTVIRKGVEAAFDQFEKIGTPVDYSADLGRIVQGLATVDERLEAVEESPILRQGAEHYGRALERSGEGLVRAAVQQLERQASDLERIGGVLASHSKSAFHRKDQDFRMWMAGIVGACVGIFLILLLPRFLPFSADSRVASLVMGQDRINAAYAMIDSVSPDRSKKLQWGGSFYDAAGGEISACLGKARETGKDQKCTITVPVPAQ